MKILYLTPGCFDKGGISRYTRYQIEALYTIFGRDRVRTLSLLGPDADSLEHAFDVDFHASGNGPRDKAALIREAVTRAVRERPDVIHAAHVNLSGMAVTLAAAVRARAVLNVYGLEVWSGLRPDAAMGLRLVPHVISDCHFTARYVRAHGTGKRAHIGVVWDCVDVDKLTPGAPRPDVLCKYQIPDPATGINVLTLGRLSQDAAHKGYDRLLEAFARASATVPELRLIYAGRGNLIEPLRARAAAMGLGDRVHFTGAVHEDDMIDVYRSAHVFSLASDRGRNRGEGLPLTPLEASACGVPIIVGNQDGSQEAIVGEANGFVIDPFDLHAHARRLIQLARRPDLRAAMGAAARERAESALSYQRFVAEHRALYATWLGDEKIGIATPHGASAIPARSS
ncbi:Glycosyltransferase [Minicystis rosea]|nr:Glycosyltransferase [Minicystis rosea]